MKHNERCENAKPKSKCRCGCGGVFHARNSRSDELLDGTRTVNENIGGALGAMIAKLKGRTLTCEFCGGKKSHKVKLNSFLAYPHEGGLADAAGNRWWLYFECPVGGYQWSWGKLEWRTDPENNKEHTEANDGNAMQEV
jgi:hypothetical protein